MSTQTINTTSTAHQQQWLITPRNIPVPAGLSDVSERLNLNVITTITGKI